MGCPLACQVFEWWSVSSSNSTPLHLLCPRLASARLQFCDCARSGLKGDLRQRLLQHIEGHGLEKMVPERWQGPSTQAAADQVLQSLALMLQWG